MSKKGLGRGLGALIPDVTAEEKERGLVTEVEVRLIEPNPRQPRKWFEAEKLEELAASIREHGVVQPIVVRARGSRYEIVAGERRWRAAQLAGLAKIPALVRDFSDVEVMEIALIENLQREDLNPLEEAEAYHLLLKECDLTQEELAKRLGRSRPQIANTIRLLQLGPIAREEVKANRLSMGHAKVLLGVEDSHRQGALALRAAEGGLSVRELEAAIRRAETPPVPEPAVRPLGSNLQAVEQQLREWFGTPVKLVAGERKGRIEITYYGDDGLGRILDALGLSEATPPQPPKGKFTV